MHLILIIAKNDHTRLLVLLSFFQDLEAYKIPCLSQGILITYGYNRLSKRGNGIVSRTCSTPVSQATVRSRPSPNPECGTLPYLCSFKYHSYTGSVRLCSLYRCSIRFK